MNEQRGTGIVIVLVILFLFWWLSKRGLAFLHGSVTTEVQSSIALPGGQSNTPTVTTYPDTSACCS